MKPLEQSVLVNGYTVYYKTIGKGDPVILIHGLSGSTRWWRRNIYALSQKYKIFLIDLPGFGRMRRFPRRLLLKDSAVWIKDWMTAVGIEQAHFIGHSMGGYICLDLAVIFPEKICCMVLISPIGIISNRSILHNISALLRAIRYLTFSFIPILLLDALRAGPITIMQFSLDVINEEIRGDIKNITLPTLLIWGRNDTLVPPQTGKILQSLVPHAALLVIDNAGHVPMFDQPTMFNTAVLRFLSKCKKH